jgi:Zn ribbon nucleic-acid-binding protein
VRSAFRKLFIVQCVQWILQSLNSTGLTFWEVKYLEAYECSSCVTQQLTVHDEEVKRWSSGNRNEQSVGVLWVWQILQYHRMTQQLTVHDEEVRRWSSGNRNEQSVGVLWVWQILQYHRMTQQLPFHDEEVRRWSSGNRNEQSVSVLWVYRFCSTTE